MAISLSSACCVACCDVIVDSCDVGPGTGFIQIKNAGDTTGIQIAFSAGVSAFGAAAASAGSGNASCRVPISATCAIASCTMDHFVVYNSATALIWSGTIATSGGDLNFSNLACVTGDTIVITALNFIVAPA